MACCCLSGRYTALHARRGLRHFDVVCVLFFFFFFQAEDGIRDYKVTGVQTCALPISSGFETVTSRGPIAAVASIARATESWVDETTVVEPTVMPAPNPALAPALKFVPVTVTVRFAP